MSRLRRLVVGGLLLAGAGCGGGDGGGAGAGAEATATPARTAVAQPVAGGGGKAEVTGTEIIVAGSDFGDMLFGADRQALYIFERDRFDSSTCYGECAEAWPPVYTKGEPVAGDGVKASLLGTVKRRDGRLQVTYDGQPLYSYAHEGPGEVRCHNVSLNGGFWWVVGPDGKRRP